MSLFTNLFLISSIHGGLLIFVLVIQNRRQFNENAFLLLLLAIVTGYVFREYLYLNDLFEAFPHLMAFFVPWLYLLGPIYFFYVRFSISRKVNFEQRDLLHLIPALIVFATILPFYIKSGAEKLAMFEPPSPGNLELATNRIFYYGFLLISWLYYAMQSLSLIKHKMNAFDSRTLKPVKARLFWLKNYTIVFIAFLFCFLSSQILFVFTDFYPYYVMLSTVLAASLLIHFVGYWALRESRITNSELGKTDELPFTEEKVRELKQQIIYLLENKRIYVDADVSIGDLSQALSINTKYLSQLINKEFNCSLTSLINSYRIEDSKEMIISRDYDHLNFLGIATKVGFNTKNTFTRAFKRHTGMTPSQFKVQIEQETNIHS
ncbi:MAG: helix-turn-helix transcriptional regulator [Cyclobacteriaceae bacterium]